MRKLILILGFFSGILLLTDCSSDNEIDLSSVGYDYFPLEVGRYIDYQVEQEIYTADGQVTMDSYQLRISVADSFPNDAGSITYILYRYSRSAENEDWTFQSTWSARREQIRGITVEGNVPFQTLSFPPRNGLRWDGNILNSSPPDTYTIDSLGVQYEIEGFISGESLTVIQEDLLDFVIGEEDRRYEVYLKGVGLVEKGMRVLNLCTTGGCGSVPIESGTIYSQKAIGYGEM